MILEGKHYQLLLCYPNTYIQINESGMRRPDYIVYIGISLN